MPEPTNEFEQQFHTQVSAPKKKSIDKRWFILGALLLALIAALIASLIISNTENQSDTDGIITDAEEEPNIIPYTNSIIGSWNCGGSPDQVIFGDDGLYTETHYEEDGDIVIIGTFTQQADIVTVRITQDSAEPQIIRYNVYTGPGATIFNTDDESNILICWREETDE